MNETLAQLEQWAQKIGGIVESAAPKVWSTATAVERAGSLGLIVIRGVVATVTLAVAILCGVGAVHQARVLTAQICVKQTFQSAGVFVPDNKGNYQTVQGQPYTEQVCKSRSDQPDGVVLEVEDAGLAMVALIALIMAISSLSDLCDPWVWIGGFKPELSVAKDIMDKVLD